MSRHRHSLVLVFMVGVGFSCLCSFWGVAALLGRQKNWSITLVTLASREAHSGSLMEGSTADHAIYQLISLVLS